MQFSGALFSEEDSNYGICEKGDSREIVRPRIIKPIGKVTQQNLFGGSRPTFTPGYIHYAQHGVLFLDECTRINLELLESLCGIMDDRKAQGNFPTYGVFQLLLAANICACASSFPNECICTVSEKRRYKNKLPLSLLDRIDLHIPLLSLSEILMKEVRVKRKNHFNGGQRDFFLSYGSNQLKVENTHNASTGNGLYCKPDKDKISHQSLGQIVASLGSIVLQARQRSYARWQKPIPNAYISEDLLLTQTQLSLADQDFLQKKIREYKYSDRAYTRVLALAWSIADYEGSHVLTRDFLTLALELKESW